ncbi:MAG TPA: lysylphosphatidylglycerol synthase transmembrane domain-containing protein [Aggregatilineales bacterium]|nr:flippase-like domain-containing protein [Anaerolineales bacterium]HRE46434.1 lysylphosphatidylglycerol synthase transmembrane domain-containing protein [Aggregatilineales bacterium]
MKRWASILLGLAISAATLALALGGQDFSQIGGELRRANYFWVLPCAVFVFVGLVFRGFRWRVLLNDRTNLTHSFHIMNVGYFFNAWLPLRLGEVARTFLVTRLTPPISMFTALSSVVVERLIDLGTVVVLVILAIVIAPVSPDIQRGALISAVIAAIGIGVLLLFARRRDLAHRVVNLALRLLPFLERLGVRKILDNVLDGIAPVSSPRLMGRALGWSSLGWAMSVVAGFILMYTLYDEPHWEAALLMIAAASIAIALPAVPGSVGPFEAAIILGLNAGGMVNAANPQTSAFAFAVILHIVTVAMYAILGWIGLLSEKISFGEVIRSARRASAAKQEADNLPPTETVDNA